MKEHMVTRFGLWLRVRVASFQLKLVCTCYLNLEENKIPID